MNHRTKYSWESFLSILGFLSFEIVKIILRKPKMGPREFERVGSFWTVGRGVYLSPRKPLKFGASYSIGAVTPDS